MTTDVERMCRKIVREELALAWERLRGVAEYGRKYEWTEAEITAQARSWRRVARALRKMAGRLDTWAAQADAKLREEAKQAEFAAEREAEREYRQMLRRAMRERGMFRVEHPQEATGQANLGSAMFSVEHQQEVEQASQGSSMFRVEHPLEVEQVSGLMALTQGRYCLERRKALECKAAKAQEAEQASQGSPMFRVEHQQEMTGQASQGSPMFRVEHPQEATEQASQEQAMFRVEHPLARLTAEERLGARAFMLMAQAGLARWRLGTRPEWRQAMFRVEPGLAQAMARVDEQLDRAERWTPGMTAEERRRLARQALTLEVMRMRLACKLAEVRGRWDKTARRLASLARRAAEERPN